MYDTMAKSFVYQPLSGSLCIRVLELSASRKENALLEGRLVEVDLGLTAKQRSSYEALSYVWGSPEGNAVISCHGQEIPITKNCELSLRQLRCRFRTRRLWVDAICINQKDIEERSNTVSIMDKVYHNAQHVQIWLGSPEKMTFGITVFRINLQCTRWIMKPFRNSSAALKATFKLLFALVLFPFLSK
jgi:hypothetical protein